MNGLLTSANAMLSTLVLVAARLQGFASVNNRGGGGRGRYGLQHNIITRNPKARKKVWGCLTRSFMFLQDRALPGGRHGLSHRGLFTRGSEFRFDLARLNQPL